MHKIIIPNWRPTRLNLLVGVHWGAAAKCKKLDRNLIAVYCRNIPVATSKRRVSLHIVLTGRQKQADPDAYWKSLLDGLVKCKMLTDDNDAGCELGGVTYERGAQGSTTIILEDL